MIVDSKVAFVILHYQNMDVTIESIDFLKNIHNIEKHDIIVVDNASPNKSGNLLKEMYSAVSNIHILQTAMNGGFAYGNNIGYRFAKNELGAQIIVVMNSDVDIKDYSFIDDLLIYSNAHTGVSVLAPDIIVKNEFHQNPYMYNPIATSVQKRIILKKQIGRLLYGIPMLGKALINRQSVRDFQPNKKEKVETTVTGCVPHGACIIYLPQWIKRENIAFIEGTFLFVEEELLYDYCIYKHHQIQYEPEFIVYHMEDASQNAINSSAIQKKRNQMMFEIESRKILVKTRKNRHLYEEVSI